MNCINKYIKLELERKGRTEMSSKDQKKNSKLIAVMAVAVVALLVILHFATDRILLSPGNLLILAGNMTVPTIIALGFTFIFACNITDLSPGAIVLLTANCAGVIGNACVSPAASIPAMLAGCIAVGVICGLINFTIYRVTKIPPWIAGLGMTMVYEAIVGIYSQMRAAQGLQVEFLRDEHRILGRQPWVLVVLVICVVIAYSIYNNTSIGINIRAAGCNESVAKTMGIHVSKTLIIGGVISGLFFGIAGVVKESVSIFTPAQGGLTSLSTVFQPLAAVLLAKTLSKYINRIIAVPISTFIIVIIFNVLTLFGVPSGTFQEFLLGTVVIIFAIFAQRGVKGVVK